MRNIYYRTYQKLLRLTSYLIKIGKPRVIEGEHSLLKLPFLIKESGLNQALIVTDQVISQLGLLDGLINGLKSNYIQYVIYDKTVPNPTTSNIEEALTLYKLHHCDSIIAFGGGSPMDCAKVVGARVAKPNMSVSSMKGILKIRRKIPPLFAVPTTSGTGSESTLTAVVTDPKTLEKYTINDVVLIPKYAVLDPLLTLNLPPHITSSTGMDALTHAIEAFINKGNTKESKELSQQAIILIYDNIKRAYFEGSNITARQNMQKASYLAGLAFTRAYVGYVHAIAHTLGGFYSYPHGLANAIILPYVLEYYGEAVYQKLAELADLVGICDPTDSNKQKSIKFIDSIKQLNKEMRIPNKIDCIKKENITVLAERAIKEANPLYPVPKILTKHDLIKIYNLIIE